MDPFEILELYERPGLRAARADGLSPLQHAWQCARLARAAGATPELQLAAWLHDLGQLVTCDKARASLSTIPHRSQHALRGATALLPLFGAQVSGPVALQVEAKRCLAALRPAYQKAMSAADVHRLALQGGPMAAEEARAFLQRPHAPAALRLRLWDDAAHDPDARPPSVDAALDALARLMRLLGPAAHRVPGATAPAPAFSRPLRRPAPATPRAPIAGAA